MRWLRDAVMVQVGIFAVLVPASCVAPLVGLQLRATNAARAEQVREMDLMALRMGIDEYWRAHRRPPAALEEVVAAGIFTKLPRDPWGNPYVYRRTADGAQLASLGSDGEPGGDGFAADIGCGVDERYPSIPPSRACW